MEDYKYTFSVVIPVYNAEEYLEETIDCILNQTIGFINNIQIIIVNDGSTDSSEIICEKYVMSYPHNIIYINKDNGGVSSARNEGIKHIDGKYTIFLDGDDVWDHDAFRLIDRFFNDNVSDVSACTCKMEYIGDYLGSKHPLEYKFNRGNRVVSILDTPEVVCSTIGNMVFKTNAVINERFDESLISGEDSKFTNSVLLKHPKLGILSDAVFYYRRYHSKGSGSSNAILNRSWYLDSPELYYLNLENESIELYGRTITYIQNVILYDLRWRDYDVKIDSLLSQTEKLKYITTMRTVVSNLETEIILKSKGLSQYKKLYLLNLKYDRDIILESIRDNMDYLYNGYKVLSFNSKSMLRVKSFDLEKRMLHIDGIIRAVASKRPYKFIIRDNDGNTYFPTIKRGELYDIRGLAGELICEGQVYSVDIPICIGAKLYFYVVVDGQELPIKPAFDNYLGIKRSDKNNYKVDNGFIIKVRRNVISFYKDRKKTRIMSELRLSREKAKKNEADWLNKRIHELRITKAANDKRIRNRVAFISVRSNGEPLENLKLVYEGIEVPKKQFCNKNIQTNFDNKLKALELAFSSKVVVTDDYLSIFRDHKKKEEQYFVQLWHAAGAFKKFGADSPKSMYPGKDAMYHRDYDIVAVSSEYVRDVYANAFGISHDKVKPLGVPRSDIYFQHDYLENTKEKVFKLIPDSRDKQVILYSPTFRNNGKKRNYLPNVDYDAIDKNLQDDQIMIICPHPLMKPYEGKWPYRKIKLIQNISTSEVMIAADILITDYSSVIFEYSLLDKPMAFFCFDYDDYDYDRGFYLDYNNELPGELLRNNTELIDYLSKGKFMLDDKHSAFRHKYMSACDGKSTKRITEVIEKMIKGEYEA